MITVLMLALAADSASANAAALRCDKGFERLRADVIATPDIKLTSRSLEFEAYEDRKTFTVYTLTLSGHYAHPAIFERTIRESGDQIGVDTSACCYNSKRNCDRLNAEMEAVTESIRDSLPK